MRQNRSSVSSKGQRNKIGQINLLKDDLMSKINHVHEPKSTFKDSSSHKTWKYNIPYQLDDLQTISFDRSLTQQQKYKPMSILQKAKQITHSNRQKIESAKKNFKKSNPQNDGMFLTGCGLYKAEEDENNIIQNFQCVDLNDALKFLVSHEKDDLQQLRKMIQKTSFDIKQYSEEVTKTTGTVQNAADLFGKNLNTDLRVKINRCKPIENDLSNLVSSDLVAKRKISTSGKSRKKNIY